MPSADDLQFLTAVANDTRLRIIGLLALEPRSVGSLAKLLGTRAERLSRHIDLLVDAGLAAQAHPGRNSLFVLTTEWLRADNVVVARLKRPASQPPVDDESRVLAAFVREGRLVRFPAALKKKLVVLQWIVSLFRIGVRYPEREINGTLKGVHADFATLRRALIDHGFMRRDHGIYWRPEGSE
jgi:hypothetical protein